MLPNANGVWSKWKAKAGWESVDVTIYMLRLMFSFSFLFLWIIRTRIDVPEIVEFAALVWNKMVTKKFIVSWWTGSIFIGGSRPGNAKRIFFLLWESVTEFLIVIIQSLTEFELYIATSQMSFMYSLLIIVDLRS